MTAITFGDRSYRPRGEARPGKHDAYDRSQAKKLEKKLIEMGVRSLSSQQSSGSGQRSFNA